MMKFSFLTKMKKKTHTHSSIDARSCLTCDKVLAELEKIDDDTDSFGVDFVKINDKRLAKQYGIKNFPALTYFRYSSNSRKICAELFCIGNSFYSLLFKI